jgi:hypothetical protein
MAKSKRKRSNSPVKVPVSKLSKLVSPLNYLYWQNQKKVRLLLPPPPPVCAQLFSSELSCSNITQINAPVPAADTEKLHSFAGPSKDHRSAKSKLHGFIESAKAVTPKWLNNAPTFKIKGVKLSVLKQRKKNSTADIKAADVKIEEMKDLPADACSGRFLDEDGFLLACVFAHNLLPVILKANSNQSRANIPVRIV